MSVSIADFWQLLEQSRLLASEQVRRLRADYAQIKGADQQGNAKALVEWLISRNAISRYQATVLTAGRSGPFYYGDYRVYDRIAEGRLVGRFRAIHGPTNHLAVLRFLTGSVTRDARQWAAVARFAEQQAKLASPHVQRIFEPVDLTSFKFIVEEDLHGQSLDERLAAGPIPHHEAARIARLACLGLAHLHQQNLVHGDLRPANIWLDRQGNVLLLRDANEPPTAINFALPDAQETLQLRGDYLAPELGAPERAPTPLSDIYGLGCVLYQMLAGRPPYAGGEASQKLRRHASEPPQPLETMGVPQPLAQTVVYMLAKNPQVRFPQAGMIVEQLGLFIEPSQLHWHPPAAAPTLAAFEQWIRQKQAALAAAAKSSPTATSHEVPKIVAAERGKPVGGPVVTIQSQPSGPTEPMPTAARGPAGRGGKSMTPAKLAGILGATGAVLIVGLLLHNSLSGGPSPSPTVAQGDGRNVTPVTPTAASTSPDTPLDSAATSPDSISPDVAPPKNSDGPQTAVTVTQEIVEDASLLWASPTSGSPLNLQYIPPGGQVFLVVRPAAMLSSSEGTRVLQALGPLFDATRGDWEKSAGVKFGDVEQLTLALYENGDNPPRTASVVRLRSAVPDSDLLARWGNPAVPRDRNADDRTPSGFYAAGDRGFYIPLNGEGRFFTIGAAEDIRAAAALAGGMPPLRRDIERLRMASDSDRHFNLLFAPNFLFSGARKLLENERVRLREPLEWFLGEGLTGGLVSAHVSDDSFYVEARFASTVDKDKLTLANHFRDRLGEIPRRIEAHIAVLNPHPYWRLVAFRYPRMVGFLSAQTRVGTQDEHAVVNAVLPGPAAHNLVFGGAMLVETPAGQAIAAATTPAPAKKVPQSVDELLAAKTTLTFDATQLEFAVRDLATDLNDTFPGMPFTAAIRIIGPHLEKDGITRNQQVRDFNLRDQTVADILTAIVKKANPVPNVPDTSHPDQKLIWVVGPDPDNPSERIVLITTRTAAAENNYTLPAPFVLKE